MPRCQRCLLAQAASRPPPRQAQPSPASLASDGQRRWHCWIPPEPVPATHSITTRPPSASAVQSGPGSLIRTRRGIRSSFFAFLLLSRSLSAQLSLFLSVLSVPHTILFLSFFLPSFPPLFPPRRLRLRHRLTTASRRCFGLARQLSSSWPWTPPLKLQATSSSALSQPPR